MQGLMPAGPEMPPQAEAPQAGPPPQLMQAAQILGMPPEALGQALSMFMEAQQAPPQAPPQPAGLMGPQS
jgi:hypothetical protein